MVARDTRGKLQRLSGLMSIFLESRPDSPSPSLPQLPKSVGPFIKVNRIRDASGKPKGFGFVEYGDAETVLRCLSLINGVTLVGRDGDSKALTVKADAKVRERLDVHEASRMADSVGLHLHKQDRGIRRSHDCDADALSCRSAVIYSNSMTRLQSPKQPWKKCSRR